MKKEYPGLQDKEINSNGWIKYDRFGYEGLSEILSYRFSRLLSTRLTFCEYTPIKNDKGIGCFSKSVVTDNEELISLYSLFPEKPDDFGEGNLFVYYIPKIVQITGLKDFGEWLTEMFIFDMLIVNEDRNPGNIQLIKTGDRYGYAPVMDNANSLGYKDENDIDIEGKTAKPLVISHHKQVELFKSRFDADLKLAGNKLKIYDLYDFYTLAQVSRACKILNYTVSAYFGIEIKYY